MKAKNEVSARFIEAYEALFRDNKVSDKRDFAAKLGISASMVTEISKGRSSVGTSAIQNIVLQFNIDAKWLLTGEGSMLQTAEYKSEPTEKRSVETAHHVPEGSGEGIPLLPISAMAGAFTGDVSVMEYECERYVIPAFKGADFMIRVTGDSMFPTYRSGDLVACQRVPLSDLFFQWNKVYVLDTIQGPLIKRIKRGSDQEHILIVSDNPDYEPYEFTRSQFHGVALVRGVVRIE